MFTNTRNKCYRSENIFKEHKNGSTTPQNRYGDGLARAFEGCRRGGLYGGRGGEGVNKVYTSGAVSAVY